MPTKDRDENGLKMTDAAPTVEGAERQIPDVEYYERHPSDTSYQDHPDYP